MSVGGVQICYWGSWMNIWSDEGVTSHETDLVPPQHDLVHVEGVSERVDSQLVGGHHDGGVGDLSDQLSAQASVQPPPPLLPVHQSQSLPEWTIHAARLPQPGPRDLCK